jgi:alpha-tubulin suppressor-like RCC1 family protein
MLLKVLSLVVAVALLATAYGQKRVLFGMGSNAKGQLAQNDVTKPNVLFSTLGGQPVTHLCTSFGQTIIYSGMWRVVAINAQGKIYGWGNIVGASILGLNSIYPTRSTNLGTPTFIYDLGTAAVSISCGDVHTLIKTAAGDVYGFGENSWGQFGNGNTTALFTPTLLPHLQSYAKIWAVGGVTLAVTSDGRVFGAGGNNVGQLGPLSGFTISNMTEMAVPGTASAGVSSGTLLQVAGSTEYTYYLTSGNNLYVTGSDSAIGRLGLNSTAGIVTSFSLVKGSIGFIETQTSSSIAISSDGLSTYVWGDNTNSIMCLNSTTTSSSLPEPIPQLTNQTFKITKAKLGSTHSIFVADNGQMFGCGDNAYNEIGQDWNLPGWVSSSAQTYGPLTTSISANKVQNVTTVALLPSNSFLIIDSQLYGWGKSNQLGIMFQFPSALQINSTLAGSNIDDIKIGNQFSVVQDDSGLFYGFGSNSATNILDSISLDFFAPVELFSLNNYNVTNIAIGGGIPATTITFSNYAFIYGLANISSTSTVSNLYGMGMNDFFQLGQGVGTNNVTQILSPVTINSQDFNNTNAIYYKVDAGFSHGGILVYANSLISLYLWGSNANGQLGLRTLQQRESMIRLDAGVVDFALGDYHSLYIQKVVSTRGSGQVTTYTAYAAGQNLNGQLGLGSLYYSTAFLEMGAQINNTVSPLSNLTLSRVWTGADQSWILTNLGLFVMGSNAYGQLGLGVNVTSIRQPILHTFTPFQSSQNVLDVACSKFGGSHTLILMTNGDVYVMGRNDNGQLGLGDYSNRYTPTLFPRALTGNSSASSSDVVQIAAGVDHSLMVVGTQDCPNDCNGKGVCNPVTGLCSCYSEYLGEDCSLYQCITPNCNLHGYCDTTKGVCVCNSALYTGLSCEYRRCTLDCSGRGSCAKSTGSCVCDPGFSGLGCETTSGASAMSLAWLLLASLIVFYL